MWIVTVVVLLCWSKVLLFLMLPAMESIMAVAVCDQWCQQTLAQDSEVCKKVALPLHTGKPADAETTVKSVHPSKEEIPTSLGFIFIVSLNGVDSSFLPSPFCSSFATSAGSKCS